MVLEELEGAALPATFFVEGRNGEDYPEALRGSPLPAMRSPSTRYSHEDWGRLTAAEEAANLDRGLAALRALGFDVTGFRPPGGLIGPTTAALLHDRGVRYCSPAGTAPGRDGVVVLPFAWPAVDVFHVLPQFAALRAHVAGSDEAGGPDAVRAALLERSIGDRDGGHAVLVLHTWMAEHERTRCRTSSLMSQSGWHPATSGRPAATRWRRIAGIPRTSRIPPQLDRTSWQSAG